MKVNAPKRKVFQDAVDLISPENVADNGQVMISVEKIEPFHNHPFRLYEGKHLDDMVESIKEHGVLIPVIVLKIADGYEMLSGHNRWNAAKIAGIKEIPAIIKENLTEREAYVYVIETNMLQRSFDDLLPSEKAAVLAERYEKVMCQGRRNDILEEIEMLNGVDVPETCGHDVHKSKSRDSIGEDYGMTGRNIARYMRLNQTTDQIKEMVDDGAMAMVTAVELFDGCFLLRDVVMNGEITSIASGAFKNCRSLEDIALGDNLTEIGSSAFYCCYALKRIKLPKSIKSIASTVFYSCYALQEIVIPENVTEIKGSAFSSCCAMEHYYMMPTVPPALENVSAFSGIPETCKIHVPKGCLEAYQTAENWSTYADYMVEMEE